jgi:hypothetical protein
LAFDLSHVDAVAVAIRRAVTPVAELLDGSRDPHVRRRAATSDTAGVACHVRDVLLVQRERVLTALRVDVPEFSPMGRDERAHHDGYVSQRPEDVSRQLRAAGLMFCNVLGRIERDGWDRRGVYGYPTREERSLSWIAVHTLHEVIRHAEDIKWQLA